MCDHRLIAYVCSEQIRENVELDIYCCAAPECNATFYVFPIGGN